ncbi:MAG: glycosyltransferase [Labilithrix sp.]|nr:glycosyltransferase [Labilithrix sp.]
MFEVNVAARSIAPFAELVGHERVVALEREAAELRELLGARAIFNVNSTAAGGGVAEMLRPQLRYARGRGILTRWLVIEGPAELFRITKRLHNALHDVPGDGSPLGPEQARIYERAMRENAVALDALVRDGDIVICHDPQTAGLVPHLLDRGALVVWRCHIGHEKSGVEVDRGWSFLRKYVENVPVAVFSRGAYAPDWLSETRTSVLKPTIDPFSAKNQPMTDDAMRAILCEAGLIDGAGGCGAPIFTRDDGSVGRVDSRAEVMCMGPAPAWNMPLVVQVSRWDRMKDPVGVLEGFAYHVASAAHRRAQLVLAGPQMRAVADDPEGPQVFGEVERVWRELPKALRQSILLAQLPMDDEEENAAIVNALQRHATVVIQKSLREGFGLTVTEAMWKSRPVVASAVGGIQDQIDDGVDGVLVHDPRDMQAFGDAICGVLDDPARAKRLGAAAHRRVLDGSLSITSLEQWAALVRGMLVRPSDAV